MAKGTEMASLVIILAGLALCAYPLATGFSNAVPLLDNEWDLLHTAFFIAGGLVVAGGVALEYRAEQVEATRITRTGRRKGPKTPDHRPKTPHIRDAFVVGWDLSSMLLLPIGVAFYYIDLAGNFTGVRPAHTILFGFYLGMVISLPVALYFAKRAINQ